MRRVLKIGGAVLVVLLVAAAAWIGPDLYRIFHGVDVYETEPPAVPETLPSPAFLVFSKTNGYRHDEAIDASNAWLAELAEDRRWGIYFTENGAVHDPALLARFDAVVWNNVSRDVLTDEQRAALRHYIEVGGGFVGIHASGGDTSYRWQWYVDDLIGAQFTSHTLEPQFQDARVVVTNATHPVTAQLPAEWQQVDEWYSFQSAPPADYTVLLALDEDSYDPLGKFGADIAMGEHPIAWSHCVGEGRVVYSALGHEAQTYSTAPMRTLLTNALQWTATASDCRQTGEN